jgi:hypothetical protein
MHSRNHSMTYPKEVYPPLSGLGRKMSKREKFVRAITNPDLLFRHEPGSPPPESKYLVSSPTFPPTPVMAKANGDVLVGLTPTPTVN